MSFASVNTKCEDPAKPLQSKLQKVSFSVSKMGQLMWTWKK